MKQEKQSQQLMGASESNAPEQELLNQMVAEAVEYVHGRARNQIVDKLTNATNTSETMGAITYKAARGLLEKHKEAGMAMEIDMSLALGLATEIIDMQVEILEKVAPERLGDPQKTREDALMRTMMLHAEQLKDDPEAQEQAKQVMASFMQDGTVDQAFGYINQRAKAEGLSTEDMITTGTQWAGEMVGGGQKPVAQGVQQGLMNQPQ